MILLLACGSTPISLDDIPPPAGHAPADVGDTATDIDADADSGDAPGDAPGDDTGDPVGDSGDDPVDSGGDIGDTGAPVACSPAWGDVASAFDGFDQPDVPPGGTLRLAWAISGSGAVCAVSCSEPWASVLVGVAGATWAADGTPQAEALPLDVSAGGWAVAVELAPPEGTAPGTTGGCLAETSAGVWTLTFETGRPG